MGHSATSVIFGTLGFLLGSVFQKGVHVFEGFAAPTPSPPSRPDNQGCELAERCLLRLEASIDAQWSVNFCLAVTFGGAFVAACVGWCLRRQRTASSAAHQTLAAGKRLALTALDGSDEDIPAGYVPARRRRTAKGPE